MENSEYQKLADVAFRRIERAFADVDPDDADCELAGDVLTFTFKGGAKCIVNTQRPTRQIWLAATSRAWHFSYDAATGAWMDDKGQGTELFSLVAKIVKDASGLDVAIS